MENILTVDNVLLFVCSFTGSIKASSEFNNGKSVYIKIIDIAVGLITGMALVHHFTSQLSLALSALVALVGGASGGMVLEVIMTMLPSLTKISVKAWLKKWVN